MHQVVPSIQHRDNNMELTEEELAELREEFKDTQLPDPEMYPESFEYCVKVWRVMKQGVWFGY